MRTKFLRRAEKRQGLFSPEGQISLIDRLFKKEKVKPGSGHKRDLGPEKIWMRKGLRSKLEAKMTSTVFSGMPKEMPEMVRKGQAMEFVRLVAQRKYGAATLETLPKAREDCLRLTRFALDRSARIIRANTGVRALGKKLPKQQTAKIKMKKSIYINAADGLGTVTITHGGGFLELFEQDLLGLKF